MAQKIMEMIPVSYVVKMLLIQKIKTKLNPTVYVSLMFLSSLED